MEEYFNSKLAYFEITWETYPSFHNDNTQLVKPFNQETFRELRNCYEKIFGSSLKEFSREEVLYPIAYYVINLPHTLTDNPTELIRVLNKCENDTFFEKTCIQTIIDYKWETYTKWFFIIQFILFMVFILFFILDLFIVGINDTSIQPVGITFKGICLAILSYFMYYECT